MVTDKMFLQIAVSFVLAYECRLIKSGQKKLQQNSNVSDEFKI